MSFFQELRRRNVFRVGIAYVVVAWLVAQVLELVFESFGTPGWVMKSILVLMAAGLVFALFFAWIFELTPNGLKRERDADCAQSVASRTAHKLDLLIMVVLALSVIYFAVDKFALDSPRDDGVQQGAAGTAATPSGQTTLPEHPDLSAAPSASIAVLPFVNISEDAANEHFSDGLSEEILNLLARIRGLKVIARTSSFAFKGRNEDLREIGRILGVKSLLEGSVRKSGERLRITAQLVDVADGSHVWSNTYDRTMTDIFAIQDEVAAAIVDALQLHVANLPTRGRPTANHDAYTLFLRATSFAANYRFEEALDLLQKSIALDPDFAEAYELTALSLWYQSGTTLKSGEGQRMTFEAADKALKLDPSLTVAKALWVSANYRNYSFLTEIAAIENAVREQPSNGYLLDMLAWDLLEAGYLNEALSYVTRWVRLDPLARGAYVRMAEALTAAGQRGEAVAVIKSANLLLDSELIYPMSFLSLLEGDTDLAIQQYQAMMRETYGLADTGWVGDAIRMGRDPERGQAYLDQLIEEKAALVSEDLRFDFWRWIVQWYLLLGHSGRYFELIQEIDLTTSTWTDADWLVYMGTVMRETGFTAHPKYLEVMEDLGIISLWDERGPPDFCQKIDNAWVCR